MSNLTDEPKVTWISYVALFIVVIIFSGAFATSDTILKALDFSQLNGQFGKIPFEKGFDFIFADPPYALPELPDVPKIVLERGLLRPGGLFVMEHPKEYDFSNLPGFEERRVYGSVNFSLFVREEERTDA